MPHDYLTYQKKALELVLLSAHLMQPLRQVGKYQSFQDIGFGIHIENGMIKCSDIKILLMPYLADLQLFHSSIILSESFFLFWSGRFSFWRGMC